MGNVLELLIFAAELGKRSDPVRLTAVRVPPSPSRHIYNPLTIMVALLVWWHLIGRGNTSSRLTERSLNHRPVDRTMDKNVSVEAPE